MTPDPRVAFVRRAEAPVPESGDPSDTVNPMAPRALWGSRMGRTVETSAESGRIIGVR